MMRWGYWFGWNLFGSAYRALFGMKVQGRENLITDGGVLVVSNHQSFLDPPLVGALYHDEMSFMARKTLFKKGVTWIYEAWNAIPVDQDRPDIRSLKTIIKQLKAGGRVLVFPEGARTEDGTIGDGQPGVGLIAVKSGVPIQPIRIRGAREALPRGSGRIRLVRVVVSIGKPIILSPEEAAAAKGKVGYQALADRLMKEIREL